MNKYARDFVTLPGDASLAWRRGGVPGAWREMRVRTLDRLCRCGLAVVIEHVHADVPDVPLPHDVRITPFAGPDWSTLLALTTEKRIAHFRQRVARGRTCLVAWRDDRPVGFTWISTRIDHDIETYALPLPADASYHWDLFVTRDERGTGLGAALALTALHHMRESSYRVGWALFDIDNCASQRAAQRAASSSSRVIGELRHVRILGRSWSRFADGAMSPEAAKARARLRRTS